MKQFILIGSIAILVSCAKHETNTVSNTSDSLGVLSSDTSGASKTIEPTPMQPPIVAKRETAPMPEDSIVRVPANPVPKDEKPRGSGAVSVGVKSPISQNIRVTSPKAGSTVNADQFQLQGDARTFENVVSYRLKLADGTLLSQGHVQAKGPMGVFSTYSTVVKAGRSGKATLEVFENSAKDGSEINKVVVPIILSAGKA